MKFRTVTLLIAILGVTVVLVTFLQTNLPALEQEITLFSLSFSILRCWIISLLVIAALPSAYFGYKHLMLRRKVRKAERNQTMERDRDGRIAQIEVAFLHDDLPAVESALNRSDWADHPRIPILRGRLLLAQGKTPEGIAALKETFRQSRHVEAGYFLARALMASGQDQQAAEVLRDIIELDGQAVLARRQWLQILEKREDWDACLEQLAFFEQRDPTFFKAKLVGYRYAQLRDTMRQPDATKKAADRLEGFLKQYPEFVPAYVLLADWYLMQGDEKKAFGLYERGFQNTRHSIFLSRLEEYYLKHDRPEDAIQVYRKIRITDDAAVVQYQLGKLFQKLEMTRKSLEVLEPLRRSLPQVSCLVVDVADLKTRWNQTEEALTELREAIDLHPDFRHPYLCRACRKRHENWRDRCDGCGAWNEIVLEVNWQSEFVADAKPVYY